MNLIEHYILEIHSEKQSESMPDYVIVDLTVDCYGRVERTKHIATRWQWADEKYQGYYMG